MKAEAITDPAYLNMLLPDGNFFVSTRYTTDPSCEPHFVVIDASLNVRVRSIKA